MTSNQNASGNYWGFLFNPDKSASPLLEQLCLGLAKIIGTLEPGPNAELTPQRLAAFYRSVGGNYDPVFLNNSGLSFMYKTLGCFHTLQPTSSPFDAPCIPALLPSGFVEWQRLQLLLSPGEHVPFMQEAVRRYDVPTADGGIFPKYIPREAFPDRPDKGMENWHKMVTGSLEQAQYTRRLKNSPYASPRDPPQRGEGHSVVNDKLPQVRRPSRSPRGNSHDLHAARLADDRRRSSVPDIQSPFPPVLESTYRGSDAQQFPPYSRTKQAQHNAPHRASNTPSQHRTSDASSSRHRYSNSSQRTSNSSTTYRPTLSSSTESSKQEPPPAHHTRHHGRPRSPSTIDESSSGSEASSENSLAGRGRNSHEARDGRRRSSLFPPETAKHHVRRHSHDATYLPNGKPPLPPRPIENSPHVNGPVLSARSESGYQNWPTSGAVPWNANPVQFRTNVFEPRSDDATSSAPESPIPVEKISLSMNPKLRSFDPPVHRDLVRQYDADDVDQGRAYDRKAGMPVRVSTVTGVRGRKYAPTEPRSAFAGSSLSPPRPLGMLQSSDPCITVSSTNKMFARQAFKTAAPLRQTIRPYATDTPTPNKGFNATPWVLGAAAAGAAYFGYGYISGGTAATDAPASKDEQKNALGKAGERTTDKPTLKAFTGGDQGFLDLKLSNVEVVNHNTKRFRFDLPEKDQVSGLDVASAIITKYKAPDSEKPVIRPYTPVSDEDDRGFVDLLVKVYPNGPMSQHIHSMTPGQLLSFKGPIPKYPWTTNKHSHITLIAGGTGITPMYQLVRRIFNDPDEKTKVSLIFGNIAEEDILLKKEFEELENKFPNRFRAFYTLDKPPKSWPYGKGFIDEELLKTVLPGPKEENIKIFVCGPPGLCKVISGTKPSPQDQGELTGILAKLGYTKDQVYKF